MLKIFIFLLFPFLLSGANLEPHKKLCQDIGFTLGTEKFAECVMDFYKSEKEEKKNKISNNSNSINNSNTSSNSSSSSVANAIREQNSILDNQLKFQKKLKEEEKNKRMIRALLGMFTQPPQNNINVKPFSCRWRGQRFECN
jgi:hypothetical protein